MDKPAHSARRPPVLQLYEAGDAEMREPAKRREENANRPSVGPRCSKPPRPDCRNRPSPVGDVEDVTTATNPPPHRASASVGQSSCACGDAARGAPARRAARQSDRRAILHQVADPMAFGHADLPVDLDVDVGKKLQPRPPYPQRFHVTHARHLAGYLSDFVHQRARPDCPSTGWRWCRTTAPRPKDRHHNHQRGRFVGPLERRSPPQRTMAMPITTASEHNASLRWSQAFASRPPANWSAGRRADRSGRAPPSTALGAGNPQRPGRRQALPHLTQWITFSPSHANGLPAHQYGRKRD